MQLNYLTNPKSPGVDWVAENERENIQIRCPIWANFAGLRYVWNNGCISKARAIREREVPGIDLTGEYVRLGFVGMYKLDLKSHNGAWSRA